MQSYVYTVIVVDSHKFDTELFPIPETRKKNEESYRTCEDNLSGYPSKVYFATSFLQYGFA